MHRPCKGLFCGRRVKRCREGSIAAVGQCRGGAMQGCGAMQGWENVAYPVHGATPGRDTRTLTIFSRPLSVVESEATDVSTVLMHRGRVGGPLASLCPPELPTGHTHNMTVGVAAAAKTPLATSRPCVAPRPWVSPHAPESTPLRGGTVPMVGQCRGAGGGAIEAWGDFGGLYRRGWREWDRGRNLK